MTTQADEVKAALLPCPFCGGVARVSEPDAAPNDKYPWAIISFHAEGCFLMHSNINRHRFYATEAEAIAAWNTRCETRGEAVAWDDFPLALLTMAAAVENKHGLPNAAFYLRKAAERIAALERAQPQAGGEELSSEVIARAVEIFNGGLVDIPWALNLPGFVTRYRPHTAMRNAIAAAIAAMSQPTDEVGS